MIGVFTLLLLSILAACRAAWFEGMEEEGGPQAAIWARRANFWRLGSAVLAGVALLSLLSGAPS